MSFALKRVVKFLVYATLIAIGVVLTFLFGRQGNQYAVSPGDLYAPVAYADAPLGDGGDAGDGGGGSGGASGDGDCGGDGDGDDDDDGDGY